MPKGQPAAGGKAGKGPASKGGPPDKAGRGKGTGRGAGQPGNAGRGGNPKGQPAAASAPVSIANRYQKPGGGRGFGAPSQVDVLTPTVPPLYPTAPKPSPMNLQVKDRVPVYKRLSQYYNSNYGVKPPRRPKCGFNVDRYTDVYKAPLTVNADIVHRISALRLPEELNSTSAKLVKRKIVVPWVPIRRRLPQDDEAGRKRRRVVDEDQAEAPAPTNELLDEDELEEADEELDMGTDYLSNYFDNGEEFLDGDGDGMDEEGPTY